jgi:hypothetical protein
VAGLAGGEADPLTPMDATAQLLERLLLSAFLPVWMLAGLADWACHRAQRIEQSAGMKESLLHLLMIGELGGGVLAALWCEPTAALFLFLLLVCLAHELTLWWDLVYASAHRQIPLMEQWVHGVQMALPWVALMTLAIAHRDQVLAVFGAAEHAADWTWRRREPAVPLHISAVVLAAAAVIVVTPFVQELLRGWRVAVRSRP